MVALADRIRDRLKELEKSARRASIDGGLTPDAIRNVLRNKSQNPRRDTLDGIARGLDWTLEALLELQSAEGPRGNDSARGVPLISWVAAGKLTGGNELNISTGTEDFMVAPHNCRTLIALRVQGNSMNRVAPDGSIIIVNLNDRSLASDQYYIVKHHGDTIFKQFRTKPARLEADSTDSCATIFCADEIEVVGHVIEVTRKLP